MFGRKTRQRQLFGPIGDEARPLIMAAKYEDRNRALKTADGDFDLQAFTNAVFVGGLVSTARQLSSIGDDGQKFWRGATSRTSGRRGRARSGRKRS